MDFEYREAEEAYKKIVNTSGVAFYEIVSRPEEYDHALRENESLRPEDLERSRQGLRALELLEEAGLVIQNGGIKTYEVDEEPEIYGEVFGKVSNLREPLMEREN